MGAVNGIMFQPPPTKGARRKPLDFFSVGGVSYFVAHPFGGGPTPHAVLYSHGNACDLRDIFPHIRHMAQLFETTIVAYDYSGYGWSEGEPSELATYLNIEIVARRVLEQDLGYDRSHITLVGHSLGSGPTCHLAASAHREGRPYRRVVLVAPFVSAFHVVLPDCFLGLPLPCSPFNNVQRVREGFGAPLSIVHGEPDKVISCAHAHALARVYPQDEMCEVRILEHARHCDVSFWM